MSLKTNEEFLIASPGEPVINITAFTARQKVSGYVGSHVSHLLIGLEPSLIFSQKRLVWRVPIVLTTPQQGRLGEVGHLDVDARTGQLLISPDFTEQIKQHAQALTESPAL
jgi:hypothetical protein